MLGIPCRVPRIASAGLSASSAVATANAGGTASPEAKRLALEEALEFSTRFHEFILGYFVSTPLQRPLPIEATPTRKVAAYSPFIHRQGMMAASGYLFQDFYHPMTFRAILTSLWATTEARPRNQVLGWLESLGQVARRHSATSGGLRPSNRLSIPISERESSRVAFIGSKLNPMVKVALIWTRDWESIEELRNFIQAWIQAYNSERPHQALAWATPLERRAQNLSRRTIVA